MNSESYSNELIPAFSEWRGSAIDTFFTVDPFFLPLADVERRLIVIPPFFIADTGCESFLIEFS
jgi:hypothetical protein